MDDRDPTLPHPTGQDPFPITPDAAPPPSAPPPPAAQALVDDEIAAQILRLLTERGEMYTSHLCRALKVTPPAVSLRLHALRWTGLVQSRRSGRRVYHALAT